MPSIFMFDSNFIYYLFSAGIGFLLAFLLWLYYTKIIQQKKIAKKVFGTEQIYVNNDVLLEMFLFYNFRDIGNNFCLVNRRWSQIGQWHCQNRPHRIPNLILSIMEKKGRHWYDEKWEKTAYLRSWHQNASVKKLVDVPPEIPGNYEKIQTLYIEWPYNWNGGSFDGNVTNFISACSARMGACRIYIHLNGIIPVSTYCQIFDDLFLSSISQLHEIHFVFDAKTRRYSQSYKLYLGFIDWLLGKNIESKDEKTTRKLYLININSFDVEWYLEAIKKEFFNKKEKMSPFDVLFLLDGGTQSFEKNKIKNTKTGQILYSKFKRIDGYECVLMGLCNSMEELDGPVDISKTANMPTIQWNIRPGKYYYEEKEQSKKKLIPPTTGFVDLLKQN